jgi:adenylate cyclase
LLYVFIFIALRALRLEWKYVAAAGIAGAIGWAMVVIYVITNEPENTMITRSYVQYLTSNSILIGAEVDKVISILAVTGILTLVVNGSSNLLVTAVSEQAAAQSFSRFFDKRIAQDIRSSQKLLQAGEGERRNTAVINIDIRGFSVMAANREPSEVMQILSTYQGRVLPILQEHGAIIDKFMGDGIMATFGIDDDKMPFSRKAIEAAEAVILDSMKWSKEEPLLANANVTTIGIGIACGTVAFGAVGQGDRLEMTVIGSPVNTSAKLEKHNKALNSTCIISRKTWDNALNEGYQAKLAHAFVDTIVEGIVGNKSIVVLKPEAV